MIRRSMEYYAHSENSHKEKHSLSKHLHQTARLAESFAWQEKCKAIFYVTGLLHDLGKFIVSVSRAPRGRGLEANSAGIKPYTTHRDVAPCVIPIDLTGPPSIILNTTEERPRRKILSWPALWAIIFWGFSFIATKVALKEIHPFTLLTLRFGIGAFLLLVFQFYRDKRFLKIFSRRDWITILFLATIGIAGHNFLQAFGLLYTSAINTGWLIAIHPIFIALAARLFLGEGITVRKVGGIILGFFGIFLIISKGVLSLSLLSFSSTFGDLLVLLSALTWTGFTVGGRGFLSRFPPLVAITPIMMAGCLITLPLSIVRSEWNMLFDLSLFGWMGILYLGIFCSGLAYFFWYSALEKRDSSVIGMYLYLEPFVTLIGAHLLLGEEIKWITLIGGGMTLIGVYLATQKVSR